MPSMASHHAVQTSPKSSAPSPVTFLQTDRPVSPLDSTLVNSLVSVASKELTENLSLLDATLTKNREVGGVMVNQLPEVAP